MEKGFWGEASLEAQDASHQALFPESGWGNMGERKPACFSAKAGCACGEPRENFFTGFFILFFLRIPLTKKQINLIFSPAEKQANFLFRPSPIGFLGRAREPSLAAQEGSRA